MIRQIILKSRPTGPPIQDNFETRLVRIPDVTDGQVRLMAHTFSVDPYIRGRMSDARSYIAPFQIDEPIIGGGIARVLESKAEGIETGNYVMGYFPWQEEMVIDAHGLTVLDEHVAPLNYNLGILGMPGLTAYFGLFEIGKPVKGETFVVSGAAGAVGMVAGQIAGIQGCRVIGITGDDSKADYLLKELHFDSVINYKTTQNLDDAIAKVCPSGIDVYFDNVGGEISDKLITHINKGARIIICGQISLYNATSPPVGPRIQPAILKRSALMQGFIVSNYASRFPEGLKMLAQWVKSGQMKYTHTTYKGFEKLPEAFMALFDGKNLGKLIVEV
jgi:NADPH:quinone reductase